MRSFIPFFIVAICVGMYFVYIGPTITDIKLKIDRKEEYENVLSRVKEIKQKRDTLSTKYNSIREEDINKLNKIIPAKFDAVHFANDLNSISSRYGMIVRDVRINYSAPRGEVVDAQATEEGYKTISVKFALNGRYDQFTNFLRDLEKSLQLMDVVDLSVRSSVAKRGEDLNLNYILEIHTYALQ